MSDVLFWLLLVVIFILAVLVFPQWMLLRTVPKIIRIFREYNAVGEKNAKTVEELGLQPKTLYERMFKLRDYKPRTLQFMIRTTIIEMTEEGKLYLSEEKLASTRWRGH